MTSTANQNLIGQMVRNWSRLVKIYL